MPSAEDNLHCSLAENAHVSTVEQLPSVEVEKEKAKKDKDKARAAEAPSTANVATRFATKVAAEASAIRDVIGVGSLFVGPLALVEPLTHSEASVSQLLSEVRKRKVVAPNASVTSLEKVAIIH